MKPHCYDDNLFLIDEAVLVKCTQCDTRIIEWCRCPQCSMVTYLCGCYSGRPPCGCIDVIVEMRYIINSMEQLI